MTTKNETKPQTATTPAVGSSEWLGELEAAVGKLRSAYSLHWKKMTGYQTIDMDCAIRTVQNVIDTERSRSPNTRI